MADQSDVAQAIADIIGMAIYPNGMGAPPIGFTLSSGQPGTCVRINQGWPIPAQLDKDMSAGIPNVTVYPLRGKDTTRYLTHFEETQVNTPTLTLTAQGQSVTVGGTIPDASNPTNLVIVANGLPYTYQVQASDTLNSIAAALAALIPGAGATNALITLPDASALGAVRVGISGTIADIAESESRRFQITVWAPDPQMRSIIAKAIRTALAPLSRIPLSDGTTGNITFVDDFPTDASQKSAIYRRDIWYSVDYPTLQVLSATQITSIKVTAQRSDVSPPETLFTQFT